MNKTTKGTESMRYYTLPDAAHDAAWVIAALLAVALLIGGAMRIVNARELRQFEAAAATARGVHEGGVHQWDLVRAYNQRTQSVAEVARDLGIPRRTFREKHLAQLREVFAANRMDDYLR